MVLELVLGLVVLVVLVVGFDVGGASTDVTAP